VGAFSYPESPLSYAYRPAQPRAYGVAPDHPGRTPLPCDVPTHTAFKYPEDGLYSIGIHRPQMFGDATPAAPVITERMEA
jgi:hypothetical protein